ncbi:hypothetical protein AX17_007101 [Amanita inopinata Kibby_2008]|nr:hypothetical protein AX17_007101 [Amanita inopinata Kibby_2008]
MTSPSATTPSLISAIAPSLVPPDLQGASQDQRYWRQQQVLYQHSPFGFAPPQRRHGSGRFTLRPPTRSFFRRIFEYSPRSRLFSPYGPGNQFGSSLPPSRSSTFDLGPASTLQPLRRNSTLIGQPPPFGGANEAPPGFSSQTGPSGPPPLAPLMNVPPVTAFPGFGIPVKKEKNSRLHALGIVPRFLYLATMLFLPFFYRSRVHQIFKSVSLTEKEIAALFASGAAPYEPAKLKYFEQVKRSWNEFIDSLYKEWNTLNIVSVLLLTAIYNVLQLGGTGNALVQCTALMSLISALMSLTYGCLYIIRFETMRRPYKAMQWAWDALNTSRSVWWNVFILLALPSVWLAWSLTLFLVCIMAVVWQTSNNLKGLGLLPLSVQIAVSAFLFVGLVYLGLVVFTFSRYDDVLDKSWAQRLKSIVNSGLANAHIDQYPALETQEIASPPGAPIIPFGSLPSGSAPASRPPSSLGTDSAPRLPSFFGISPTSRTPSVYSQRFPPEAFPTVKLYDPTTPEAFPVIHTEPSPSPEFYPEIPLVRPTSLTPAAPSFTPFTFNPPFPNPLTTIAEESEAPDTLSSKSSSTDKLGILPSQLSARIDSREKWNIPPPPEFIPTLQRNVEHESPPRYPGPPERSRSPYRTRKSPPLGIARISFSPPRPAADNSTGVRERPSSIRLARPLPRPLPPLPVSATQRPPSESGSQSPSFVPDINLSSLPPFTSRSYDSSPDQVWQLSPPLSQTSLPLPERPVSLDYVRSQSQPTLTQRGPS